MNPDSYYYDEITFDTGGYRASLLIALMFLEDSERRYTIKERLDYAPP